MTRKLSDEEEAFLTAFIDWHRDIFLEEWPDDQPRELLDSLLVDLLVHGTIAPDESIKAAISDETGIEDPQRVVRQLRDKKVFEEISEIEHDLLEESHLIEGDVDSYDLIRVDPEVLNELL